MLTDKGVLLKLIHAQENTDCGSPETTDDENLPSEEGFVWWESFGALFGLLL